MTNNYERTPVFANLVYSDPKSDCKYLLGKKNVRSTLLAGYSLGAVMIITAMLIAYAIIFSTPLIKDEYAIYQVALIYASVWSGIFLLLPGIYCGMYSVLLKISIGEKADSADLFKYYMSPRMYIRSIGIFLRSNWFLFGVGCLLVITSLASGFIEAVTAEGVKTFIIDALDSVIVLYLIIGSIIWSVSRRKISIFLPYAIECPQVPLKKCRAMAKNMNTFYYAKSYPNDFLITFLWLLLSLSTVGILFVVHVGPMMMAKKICFYRSSTVNKFN